MSVEISGPARASVSNVVNPRANEAREQISASQIMDWVLRGYVFSVGLLVDDTTNIASVTTLADTTPTVVLQSPSGGDTIVVPLRVRCTIVDEPGGLTTIDLAFTKSVQECATTMAFSSGTALTGVINHLTKNPVSTPKASIQRNVTVTALTVVDSIVIAHMEFPDEGLAGATWAEPTFDYVFHTPLALMEGAALLLYGYAATTASELRPSITWAELPASIYKP